jgi:hypothetical protein
MGLTGGTGTNIPVDLAQSSRVPSYPG